MGKIREAVFDAGPFLHAYEIGRMSLLDLLNSILTTEEVFMECQHIQPILKSIQQLQKKNLSFQSKDFAKYLVEYYKIQLGEATGLALCKQEKIKLFFTDDLEARDISKILGFEPHGTLGLILRNFREKMITKKEAKLAVEELYTKSSLFLTRDLFDWTGKEIDAFPD